MITDPFNPLKVGLKYPKNSADIVTISHGHDDHNYVEGVNDVRKVIQGPGEYEVLGVSVIGYPVFHDDKNGSERGKNTIYVIEMDGIRLAHLGDIGHTISEDTLEELGTIDILFIPVGGIYTINPTQAAETVRSIEPKIVIPMHYYTNGMNEQVFAKLAKVDEFLDLTGLTAEKTDKISLKKSELTDDKKVIVLEKK